MKRCVARATQPSRCLRRAVARPGAITHNQVTLFRRPYFSRFQSPLQITEKDAVFRKVARPDHSPQGWSTLIDQALPPHLRSQPDNVQPTLDATDVAEILLAAQYPEESPADANADVSLEGIDVLHHLGTVQGRWSAVVWLVKVLAENFPVRHSQVSRLERSVQQWRQTEDLNILTDTPIDLEALQQPLPLSLREPRTMHELSGGQTANSSRFEVLQHRALGQVWLSLGRMAKDCAGGEIQPEVLEVLAYLHHQEIMPQSIYHFEPKLDRLAIQSPPMLSLLSSRILTSLSDAAWRAHEKLVLEEAQAKRGEYAPLRPEVPGSVYRIRVAGLRPELWIELILWSCIQGGWVAEGSQILRTICADPAWKPVSWRGLEDSHAEAEPSAVPDWNTWEYQFKTRAPDSMDPPEAENVQVARTISGEVVSAFADALVSSVSLGVGSRGISVPQVVEDLHTLQAFLERSELNLSNGSWDALIVRLLDHHSLDIHLEGHTTQRLVALSPGMHRRLRSGTTNHDLPRYVLDGNAAMPGLLYQALRGQLATGRFEAAFEIFNEILSRSDADKDAAITSFMHQRSSLLNLAVEHRMFTDNFSGIEYPALSVQIPTTILGTLLDQALEAGAYEFARWLVANNDIDGPLIMEHMYTDPHLAPALVRLAIYTNDKDLLKRATTQPPHPDTVKSFLTSQLESGKFVAVRSILQYLSTTSNKPWHAYHLATLVRTMLVTRRRAQEGDADSTENLRVAMLLFVDLVSGKYAGLRPGNKRHRDKIMTVLAVFSTVDKAWARLAATALPLPKFLKFALDTDSFNIMLEGVVETYGSAAGRALVDFWWPVAARVAPYNPSVLGERQHQRLNRRSRPQAGEFAERQVSELVIEGPSGVCRVYGAAVPNHRTMLIILEKALEETRHTQVHTSVMKTVATLLKSKSSSAGAFATAAMKDLDTVAPGDNQEKSPAQTAIWAAQILYESRGEAPDALRTINEVLQRHDDAESRQTVEADRVDQ